MFKPIQARLHLRRWRSGKATLIAVGAVAAVLVIALGVYYVNKPKAPPKAADVPIVSPEQEAAKQQAGEAGLGVQGNPGQPGAPIERMPDGKPLPM